ncbi:hypothetical protein [Streptomyces sp. NPDC048057]|uniref:hypothetical protein n=1 Tax=Streptomyces sp. NPDC048057 TaxID=3155628 RepID=UPI0033E1A538
MSTDVWAIIVSSIVGVLVGVLGAWATFRSANPKLRLQWWTVAQPPLFDSRFGGPITVSAAGITINEPRIVQFHLTNIGRRDITSSIFHNGESLDFKFNSPIVAPLELRSEPEGTRLPDVQLPPGAEGRVEVRPGHIRRGQMITVTLLLDGQDVEAACAHMPLVDVDLDKEAPGDRAREIGSLAYEVFRAGAWFLPFSALSRFVLRDRGSNRP